MNMERALPTLFQCVNLDQDNARKFGSGGKVSPELVATEMRAELVPGQLLGIIGPNGNALGVAEFSERAITPKVVWPT